MLEFLGNLFNTSGFPPRWHCGSWSAGHGWLHIVSDVAIFGAYVAIPCVLAFFVMRRKDIPFPRILWLFVAFIFACGFGHLVEAIIFWQPVYRFAGVVKFVTAVVSWGTVIALVQIVPQVLHLPGLARLNTELQKEVEERKRAELALRESEEQLAGLLTSEREARSDAERANRIKDEFLSMISHELRTPLNAILGYAQLLRLNAPGVDTAEGLQVIERNGKVQAQIIEDLLDMSRIVSGKIRLDVAPTKLADVARAAIDTVKPEAETKGVSLRADIDASEAVVLGDGRRLQQVVWNLLTNAVKFTPKGGTVTIEIGRHAEHLELRVVDTGEGIAADFLPYVFDRFRQADPSITRRHGGLGLGLSIVKSLVELHGGVAEATSEGKSQGSTFLVRLPVLHVSADRLSAMAKDAKSDGRVEALDLSGVKVLVVDDEPDARNLVRELLVGYGSEVITANSAREALTLVTQQKPDVLLSDIGMPETDGFELIRAVRALSEADGGKTPAAAVTALARAEDRKKALLSGYQTHLAKPVDAGELLAVVATLAGRTG